MKKLFFALSTVILISISVLFIQSCSNDDNYEADPKLKSLATSTEYQNFNKEMLAFGKMMKSKYAKLSKADKNKTLDILEKLQETTISENERDLLYTELNSLIKIDFKKQVNNMQSKAAELSAYNSSNDISKEELIVFMKKNSHGANSAFPKLKNGSEEDMEICIAECSLFYGIALVGCAATTVGYVACAALASASYALCCLMC
jgi:hypothetical protein